MCSNILNVCNNLLSTLTCNHTLISSMGTARLEMFIHILSYKNEVETILQLLMITIYVLLCTAFSACRCTKKSLSHFKQKPYATFGLQHLNYSLRRICPVLRGPVGILSLATLKLIPPLNSKNQGWLEQITSTFV